MTQPDKLKALQAVWQQEAEKNKVFPLDSTATASPAPCRPDRTYEQGDRLHLLGKDVSVNELTGPTFAGRSFTVTADITVPKAGTTGVIAAGGSWFGGWAFYLKDGKAGRVRGVFAGAGRAVPHRLSSRAFGR